MVDDALLRLNLGMSQLRISGCLQRAGMAGRGATDNVIAVVGVNGLDDSLRTRPGQFRMTLSYFEQEVQVSCGREIARRSVLLSGGLTHRLPFAKMTFTFHRFFMFVLNFFSFLISILNDRK